MNQEGDETVEYQNNRQVNGDFNVVGTDGLGATNAVSDDSGSYDPSVDQIMNECDDMAFDISVSETSGGMVNELEDLLSESVRPISEIFPDFEDYLAARKRKMTELEDFETENNFYTRTRLPRDMNNDEKNYRKNIPKVGPQHQARVPDAPTFEPIPPSSEYEDVIFDPLVNPDNDVDSFFEKLIKKRPLITFLDDNILAFYHKHMGRIDLALKDETGLSEIETIQQSPLTDWTAEECEKLGEAYLKYGKNFFLILKNYYPNKTRESLIQTYYVWKKSPLYFEARRALEQIALQNKGKESSNENGINMSTPPSVEQNIYDDIPSDTSMN